MCGCVPSVEEPKLDGLSLRWRLHDHAACNAPLVQESLSTLTDDVQTSDNEALLQIACPAVAIWLASRSPQACSRAHTMRTLRAFCARLLALLATISMPWQEVTHEKNVRMFAQLGDQVLRHELTGEKVVLEKGPWALHFATCDTGQRFAYIASSSRTLWANSLSSAVCGRTQTRLAQNCA